LVSNYSVNEYRQSYSIKKGTVELKESLIVKPANMPKIIAETTLKTGITQA
jgi:hypothetical protein